MYILSDETVILRVLFDLYLIWSSPVYSIYSFRPCHRRVLQQCRAHRLSWRRPSGTASVKEWSGAGAELGLEQKGPL